MELGIANSVYAKDFPQEGQNLSDIDTGFPHFGQNPDERSLCDLRRAEIIDSTSSSLTSGLATEASARRAAMAFSMRALASCADVACGAMESICRRMFAPFCKREARC